MFDKKKRVYRFGGKTAEGDGQMRELLGGKGANLADLGLPVFWIIPGRVAEQRPMLRMVSIIPGMELLAPERQLTRSGSDGSPNFLPMIVSVAFKASATSFLRSSV